jgi:hypothetical protein
VLTRRNGRHYGTTDSQRREIVGITPVLPSGAAVAFKMRLSCGLSGKGCRTSSSCSRVEHQFLVAAHAPTFK